MNAVKIKKTKTKIGTAKSTKIKETKGTKEGTEIEKRTGSGRKIVSGIKKRTKKESETESGRSHTIEMYQWAIMERKRERLMQEERRRFLCQ